MVSLILLTLAGCARDLSVLDGIGRTRNGMLLSLSCPLGGHMEIAIKPNDSVIIYRARGDDGRIKVFRQHGVWQKFRLLVERKILATVGGSAPATFQLASYAQDLADDEFVMEDACDEWFTVMIDGKISESFLPDWSFGREKYAVLEQIYDLAEDLWPN